MQTLIWGYTPMSGTTRMWDPADPIIGVSPHGGRLPNIWVYRQMRICQHRNPHVWVCPNMGIYLRIWIYTRIYGKTLIWGGISPYGGESPQKKVYPHIGLYPQGTSNHTDGHFGRTKDSVHRRHRCTVCWKIVLCLWGY